MNENSFGMSNGPLTKGCLRLDRRTSDTPSGRFTIAIWTRSAPRWICDSRRYSLQTIQDAMSLQILVKKGLRPSSLYRINRLSNRQTGILLRHIDFKCRPELGERRFITMTVQITYIKEKRYIGEGFLLRYIAEDAPWDAVRLTIAYLYARNVFVSDDMRAMLADDNLRIRPEFADDYGNVMPDCPIVSSTFMWDGVAEISNLPRNEISCRSGRSGFGSGLNRHLMATDENWTRLKMLDRMTNAGCWLSQKEASHYIDPNLFNEHYIDARLYCVIPSTYRNIDLWIVH